MCKPNIKIKKRDLDFMSPEELNEMLQDEVFLSDPRNSDFSGQHSSNVITIRQYLSEMMHKVNY